jgi:hypothetical protein
MRVLIVKQNMLFKNAVSSIQIGIEDYQSNDTRRQLSAVRNITAGILLLFKQKLHELSPDHDKEAFIKEKLLPKRVDGGKIEYFGFGRKSVDRQTIRDRFTTLGVTVDWKMFEEISTLRNDIEHFYTDFSPDTVKEIISKGFPIIRDFIREQLQKDPLTVLGKECWSVFLEISNIYEDEEKRCQIEFDKVDWKYKTLVKLMKVLRCSECHSELIKPNEIPRDKVGSNLPLICCSCSHSFRLEDVIEDAIYDLFGAEAYIAQTQGGEMPWETCPECDQDTFIYDEGCCLRCDLVPKYSRCTVCHQVLSVPEQVFSGLCGYHHNLAQLED